MFERVSRAAEKAAMNVGQSRRGCRCGNRLHLYGCNMQCEGCPDVATCRDSCILVCYSFCSNNY
jgi:hypothetical protein